MEHIKDSAKSPWEMVKDRKKSIDAVCTKI